MNNSHSRYNNQIFAYQYEYSEGQTSNHGDIEYYLKELSQKHEKVLEIGCGTGRITIPLAKAGVDITGLDAARAMIEIGQKKAVKENVAIPWLVDDAITFTHKEKFDSIFIPYNSIRFIPNERLSDFVSNIRRLLDKGGRFFFDISRRADSPYDENGMRSIDWSPELYIRELGVRLKRRMELKLCEAEKVVESKYFWEWVDCAGIGHSDISEMSLSTLDAEDYISVFQSNGFSLTKIHRNEFELNGASYTHCFVELKACS